MMAALAPVALAQEKTLETGAGLTQLKTTELLRDLETRPIKKEIINRLTDTAETASKHTTGGWAARMEKMFSEYWVQFLALVVSLIGLILGVTGFSLANKKKRKYLKRYMHEIDDAYSSYKLKTKRCEAELYRLQDQIEDQLKDGKIDENTYHLLEKRIEKYLDEIKRADQMS